MCSLSFVPSLKPFLSLRFSRLSVSRTHTKTVAKNKYSRNKVAFEIIQCVKKTRDYADANVFMRPFEIYRAALYNVYGGSRVTDVPYIIIIIYGLRAFTSSMWGSLRLAPIIISEDLHNVYTDYGSK